MPEQKKWLWRVMGATVLGATHRRAEKPTNQDSIDWWSKEQPPSSVVCLAVSDGHGNARSFRSDIGSKLAVKTALEQLQEFAKQRSSTNFGSISVRRVAQQDLPKLLVRAWEKEVKADLEKNPRTEPELGKLGKEDSLIAYGATLLTVLVSESEIVYLQLGDGDILTVSEKGEVSRPLAADERLFANETTSLCLPEAANDFRTAVQKLSGDAPPVLILVSTDGYSNSFKDDAGFKKVGSDIYEMMRQPDGPVKVESSLETWLEEATKKGSGDDISLGIIYRPIPEGIVSIGAEDSNAEALDESKDSPVTAIDPNAPPSKNLRLILDAPAESREELLNELFPQGPHNHALECALRERVQQELKEWQGPPSPELMDKLVKRLESRKGLAKEYAEWAVHMCAEALALPLAEQSAAFAEPSPEASAGAALETEGGSRAMAAAASEDTAQYSEQQQPPAPASEPPDDAGRRCTPSPEEQPEAQAGAVTDQQPTEEQAATPPPEIPAEPIEENKIGAPTGPPIAPPANPHAEAKAELVPAEKVLVSLFSSFSSLLKSFFSFLKGLLGQVER